MSVLKQKRTTSKAEFINTANQIYVETLNFLTRLSARYSRLIAEPVAKLAGEIIDHAEKANSIFPSDNQRIEMRKAHLLEARASLMALDVRLTHVYLILNQNPEGAFTTSKGNPVKSQDAMEKLDKMAQNLGELIDKENELLKLLCIHRNDFMPRDLALRKIWKKENYFTARSMDVYIAKLNFPQLFRHILPS